MIKLIIFDFDDTLADSRAASYRNHSKIIKKIGLKPVSKQKYLAIYGALDHKELVKKLYPKINYEKYLSSYKTSFDAENWKLFSGTLETLKYLKKKYKLAIITSKEEWKLEKILDNLKMRDLFEHIESTEKKKYKKK